MPRLIVIAAVGVVAALCAAQAQAEDAASTSFLTWPGKQGAPAAPAAKASTAASATVALPKQFFSAGGGADLAAPPGLLTPHPVPGSPSVSNPSTANTAANRARADMMTPTGDQVIE